MPNNFIRGKFACPACQTDIEIEAYKDGMLIATYTSRVHINVAEPKEAPPEGQGDLRPSGLPDSLHESLHGKAKGRG